MVNQTNEYDSGVYDTMEIIMQGHEGTAIATSLAIREGMIAMGFRESEELDRFAECANRYSLLTEIAISPASNEAKLNVYRRFVNCFREDPESMSVIRRHLIGLVSKEEKITRTERDKGRFYNGASPGELYDLYIDCRRYLPRPTREQLIASQMHKVLNNIFPNIDQIINYYSDFENKQRLTPLQTS